MKRKCKKYNLDEFISQNPQFQLSNISLYIDEVNYTEITEFLTKKTVFNKYLYKKRFYRILYQIFQNRYDEVLYGPEEMSEKSKDITAMKFKTTGNIRLYCKEFKQGGKKIVIICLHSKKVTKNDKRIKNLVESIAKYEYEFI